MLRLSFRMILCFGCALLTLSSFAVPVKRPTKKAIAEKQLREYYLRLDQRLFGEKDYKAAEKLLKKSADDDTMRPLAVSLLAQYHRRMERDAVAGLRVLAPEVLWKDTAKQWLRDLKEADSKRDAKYSDAVRQAHFERQPKPEEPSGIALPFPHTQMKISESNVDCALEVARCLMDLGHIQQALRIIDSQGKAFENEGRVLSYECLGDLLLKMQMFEKSVKSYQNGLKLMEHLKPTEGFDIWQKLILSRLQRKLADAKLLWDKERFGAGFIAYRDAERRRRQKKEFAQAVLLYDDLVRDHPNTVYSEAASCYRINCLLKLAESKSLPKPAMVQIKSYEKELQKELDFIKLAKRHKVPKASIDEFEAGAAATKVRLEKLRSVPVGEKAWQAARDSANSFIKASQFGLYRGEVLLDVAYFTLRSRQDVKGAKSYLETLTKWCILAPKYDHMLKQFAVPKKAVVVSSPPKDLKVKDKWGNIKWSQPAIGAIVNRRTAPWMVMKTGSEAHELLGLCKMILGDHVGAAAEADNILKYDRFERSLNDGGRHNTYKRLKLAYGRGFLICSKDTLKGVPSSICTRLIIADYHFEREDWRSAQELYRQAYGMADNLPPRASGYVTNMYAKCLEMQGDVRGALQIFSDFDKRKELKKTPSWQQAKFEQAHIKSQYSVAEGAKIYDQIARQSSNDTIRCRAMMKKGLLFLAHERYTESKRAFEDCHERYGRKSKDVARICEFYIAMNIRALEGTNIWNEVTEGDQ